MTDYRVSMISTMMHTIAGAGMGYISRDVAPGYGGGMVAFAGAITLILMNQVVKFVLKKRDFGWWMANGIWPYISVWFAVWVFVINI